MSINRDWLPIPLPGEDGESVVRIKKVQSYVAETVGMGHHGRTTLVYAGDTSWK